MIESKKVRALISGVLLARFGDSLGFTPEMLELTLDVIMYYLVGQGIADHQKSKAQIETARTTEQALPPEGGAAGN